MANKRKLSSICKQVRGVSYTPRDVTETPTNGYIPVLRANNIQNDIVFDDLVYVNHKRISPEQKLQEGDILVCASSGSKNLVGKAAMFHDFTIPEVSFGAFCKVVRPTGVFAPYLAHFFNSSYYRNIISQIAQGASINNIRNEHLDNLDVPLPEESEQKRIAERLDKVQELIALQKEQLKKMDDLIKSRFKDLFGDPVSNPKEWPLKRMGDLFKITSGGTPSRKHSEYFENGNIPWVKTGDLNTPYLTNTDEYITELGVQESSAKIFPKGTVLLAMYGATIGAVSILNIEAATNQACAAFLPIDSILPIYLYSFLFLQKKRFVSLGVGGAQPNISGEILKREKILCPPLKLQTQFADFVTKIEVQKGLLTTRLTHLETLYKSLMQEYFDASDKNKEL